MIALYMGAFGDFFKAIINAIFKPVFQFIGNLLGKVFGWLFDKVLGPLLETILLPMIKWLIDFMIKAMATVLYKILVAFLQIIEVIEVAFNILIGTRPVCYNGNYVTLIELLFRQDAIRTIFLSVTILSVALLFIFTIYSVVRSTMDFDFEGKRPIAHIMRMFFSSCMTFLSVPLMVILAIYLSGAIMVGIGLAFGTKSTTLATYIFIVASMDAANPDAKVSGYKYNPAYTATPSMEDGLRKLFTEGVYSYTDIDTVVGLSESMGGGSDTGLFMVAEIDYILAYLVSIVIFLIMAMCLLTSVSRMFEIIILYIAAPLFISVMPIDDGQKFKTWRSKFWAKIFASYGGFLAMKVYLMIVPIVMDAKLDFGISADYNYVMQIAFLVGGAWSVYKSFNLLTYFFDYQSAENEGAIANKGLDAAKSVGRGAGKALKWTASKISDKVKKNKAAISDEGDQQFKQASGLFGKKDDKGKKGVGRLGGGGDGFGGGGSRGGGGGDGGGGIGGQGGKLPKKGDKWSSGANKANNGDTERNFGLFKLRHNKEGKVTGFKVPLLFKWEKSENADKETKNKFSFLGRMDKEDGGLLKVNTNKNEKGESVSKGFSLSGIVNYQGSTKDGDKSKEFSLFGKVESGRGAFGMGFDKDGKKDKVRVTGFQSEKQEDGSMRLTEGFGGRVRNAYTTDQNGEVKKAFTTVKGLVSAKTYFDQDAPVDAKMDLNKASFPEEDNGNKQQVQDRNAEENRENGGEFGGRRNAFDEQRGLFQQEDNAPRENEEENVGQRRNDLEENARMGNQYQNAEENRENDGEFGERRNASQQEGDVPRQDEQENRRDSFQQEDNVQRQNEDEDFLQRPSDEEIQQIRNESFEQNDDQRRDGSVDENVEQRRSSDIDQRNSFEEQQDVQVDRNSFEEQQDVQVDRNSFDNVEQNQMGNLQQDQGVQVDQNDDRFSQDDVNVDENNFEQPQNDGDIYNQQAEQPYDWQPRNNYDEQPNPVQQQNDFEQPQNPVEQPQNIAPQNEQVDQQEQPQVQNNPMQQALNRAGNRGFRRSAPVDNKNSED